MRCTERETNSALYRERLTVRCTERDLHGAVQRLSLCSTERETSIGQREASMVQYRDSHYAVQRERD